VFNLTGNDNFRDPAYGGLLFNFDGTIRSGLGDPRQVQAGVRWSSRPPLRMLQQYDS